MSFQLKPATFGLITLSFQNRENKEAAYAFINFMLRPKNALKNALYVGYSTPNKKPKPCCQKEIQDDQSFYPSDETLDHFGVYQQLGKRWFESHNDL